MRRNHYSRNRSVFSTAAADISGNGGKYPNIRGRVVFRQRPDGVLVTAEVKGLPYSDIRCKNRIFGFHIHEGTSCSGSEEEPFSESKGHYNPGSCPHPYHAGDMPPLFVNKGYAFMSFFTDRFTVREIIGRVVVIHSQPDDFRTQPSGDSGEKIACGKIRMHQMP